MPIENDPSYSALEIVPAQEDPARSNPEKQVAFESGKQCIAGNGAVNSVRSDVSIKHGSEGKFLVSLLQHKKRGWMISFGVFGLIVILAALLGGILGSRNKKSLGPPPADPSTTSPSVVAHPQRTIAAVSFVSNAANVTRLYFQDNGGQILEASWASGNSTWTISKTGVRAKNGSAIAAAVSRANLPLEISVFYLNENDTPSDIIYTDSMGQWSPGTFAAQAYTAMANGSLSAIYNWCDRCANTTLFAFQDGNGSIKIGNFSDSAVDNGSISPGWTVTQLEKGLSPTSGTGLALHPFYRPGMEDSINLYYQKSPLMELSLTDWRPAALNNNVSSWFPNTKIFYPIPFGSSIAAASSYTKASNGLETWVQVLSHSNNTVNSGSASRSDNSSYSDIQVHTWSGARNGWLAEGRHPLTTNTTASSASTNANSTSGGSGSDSEKFYGSVAVTALGQAFAVTRQMQDGRYVDKIEHWQVGDDMIEWTAVGEVDTGGAWEAE